jgi:hypothetical protein
VAKQERGGLQNRYEPGSTGPGFLSLAGSFSGRTLRFERSQDGSIPSPASNIPVEHGGRATLSYGGGRWFESTRRDHLFFAFAKFATKLPDQKSSSCIFADVNVGGLDLALGKVNRRRKAQGARAERMMPIRMHGKAEYTLWFVICVQQIYLLGVVVEHR